MTEDKLIGNLLANQARLATWGFIFGGGGAGGGGCKFLLSLDKKVWKNWKFWFFLL
jgi:hypothetical protein